MTAVFKKEFRAYMYSVIGWLFIAVTLCIYALYASVYNMAYGMPYVAYAIDTLIMLFFITIPVLTMRIMAEERKQKTDQLLLTAPISVGKLIIGKYLAMAAVFLIPVVVFCCMPLLLSRYGTVPIAENYVALLAFALYGLAAIAVGLFLSSLTDNIVIAAVLSFCVLFVTYMMQGIESLISSTGNFITKILSVFDFYSHYSSMVSSVTDVTGSSRLTTVLDLKSILYFLSVIVLMLFLATQSVQKRRYSVSVKSFAMGAYSTITTVIVAAVVIVVNLIASKLPASYTSLDVTSNKLYSITEQTQALVQGLEEDVTIYVLAAEDNADAVLKQTLHKYEELSEHVKVEYINPILNPRFAGSYTSDNISLNSVIVETDKRYKVINYADIYETEVDYYSYTQTVTGYDGEGQLTSAISYCISDDMPKIYFIAGHNEYTLDSGFLTAIEKENITYETISLIEYEAIPEDAQCVIIHAPETDLSADDADKVIAYLNNGGKVLITAEYVEKQQPNLERILSDYGLTLQRGCVVDNDQNNYYQVPVLLLPNIEYTDETNGLTGQYSYILAPLAQGITVPEEEIERMTYTKLLTTSDNSLLKSGAAQIETFDKEEGDIEGPFCLGVKAEKELDSGIGTLYVFSSAQMFTDQYDLAVSGNNSQLLTNIMGTVANHEVSVSVPVKSYQMEQLTVAAKDTILFQIFGIVMIPLALLVIGIVIWARRRKQ